VDVGVHVAGGLVLDYEVDVGNVDSSGCDVSRDENVERSGAERGKCRVPLLLPNVTVESLGCQGLEDRSGDEIVGVALRLDKDDCFAEDLLLDGAGGGGLFLLEGCGNWVVQVGGLHVGGAVLVEDCVLWLCVVWGELKYEVEWEVGVSLKSVYSSTQQQCTSYSTSKYGTSAAQVQHK